MERRALIYAIAGDFNLIIESLVQSEESVTDAGNIERETNFTVSPGTRYAFNLSAGQLVLAAGAPIQWTEGMEHRLR